MVSRRTVVAGAAALAGLSPVGLALAQGKPTQLTLAVIPVENASTTTDRFEPVAKYLSAAIGIPVTLRIANDYAAVIEAQRAGNAQIAFYGPASYARAVMTGVKTEPLVNQRRDTGVNGYHSVLWVRANSPYKTVQDLKGKTLALVDPNSTSGNNAPRFFLSKEGISVDSFFGKTFYAGSHDNSLLSLAQGTADVAATEFQSPTSNTAARLTARGLLKDASGKTLTMDDFRVIYKSPLLPEGPFAVLTSLPADLRQAIKQALLDMPQKDKKTFDGLSDGKDLGFVAVSAADYEPIIGMLQFNDSQRKKQ
ncbi:phosphonate ABC transporter substrate-binding protein [Ramlibacter sp. H39-3-26]|uniref:phosphonate ABC transporter substrate-binding protein n=1 Tax=Curvibacter soli TaxID=3031331 RepID=UPI0023DC4253|nr:phosphonate ABC transporter substrate-binding protein [Ramlibacter sp. H39-3-26]MDF1485673.1 phosphonate ABC transporter substrate-binding protein [Ramlibacter sp. H39-3-26]